MKSNLYTVGKVVNTHGLKGELKVLPQTDFPDIRFTKGSRLVLFHPEQHTSVPMVVESAREHKNMHMVLFQGMNDINLVEKYKGWLLKVTEDELVDLQEDEYYYHEIIGCTVVTDEGEELGTVEEILSPGANDVWVVKRPKGKPVLLPIIDEVLLDVDVERKLIKVHIMEGLID